jgi:putative SOS response-associated peptidase YedK
MIPHPSVACARIGPVCGRYAVKKDPATLATEFDAVNSVAEDASRPDFNVAPTRQVLTVVDRHPRDEDGNQDPTATERSIRQMRWGLVPHWAKDASIGSRMINTRADSAAGKPAFRTSLKHRRCLFPADGWYEWKRDGKLKQPFFMTRPDGASLAFAGLWSTWRPKDAEDDVEPLVTCSIITTDAIGQLVEVHDRMPLLLAPEHWQRWLDPDNEDVTDLLATPPPMELVDVLELRPVSDQVNNVRNNGPQLMDRVDPEPPVQATLL